MKSELKRGKGVFCTAIPFRYFAILGGVIFCALSFGVRSSDAQDYKPGDEVVVIAEAQLTTKRDGTVDTVPSGLVLKVEAVNGKWLWVRNTKPGWLDSASVRLADAQQTETRPIVVSLLGPVEVAGAQWPKFEDGYLTSELKDTTKDRRIQIKLPDGRVIKSTSSHTTVEAEYEMITAVIFIPSVEPGPVADAIKWVDQKFDSAQITMPEKEAAVWKQWKTDPKSKTIFQLRVPMANWIEAEIDIRHQSADMRIKGFFKLPKDEDRWTSSLRIGGAFFGKNAEPLPGNPRIILNKSGKLNFALAFSPDSKSIVAGGILYDVASGKELANFSGEDGFGRQSCAFSPDGTLLALDHEDHAVRVVNIASGEVEQVIAVPGRSLRFSPNGEQLYMTSGGVPISWSIAEKKVAKYFEAPKHYATKRQLNVIELAVPEHEKWLAGVANDRQLVYLWDTSTGKLGGRLVPRPESPDIRPMATEHIQILPGGKRMIASGGGFGGNPLMTLSTWSVADGKYTPGPRLGKNSGVRLSPDGKYYGFGSFNLHCPNGVYLHDASTGEMVAKARPFSTHFLRATWSPDGEWFALGDSHNTWIFRTRDLLDCKSEF